MKVAYRLLIITIVIIESCSSFKPQLKSNGDKETIINNAIIDFSKTKKLYKRDTVFSVKVLELTNNNDILVVRIIKNNTKVLITDDITVGSKGGKVPTRYIEKEGKLFFWWDDDYALTEEALKVFSKYNLLQDNEGGWVKFPDFTIDDAQKAAHYYFCKENLTKYKKVVTNKGIGYYDPPKVNCNP